MGDKLLIVEDDPEITSALVRGLALHGFDAVAENTVAQALSRLQSDTFDAAIVDVMLGRDSGFDLVRAARDAGVTLPIVMLSALSDVDHRTEGLDAGADDYLIKPFSFDELVARLRVQQRRVTARTPEPAQLCREDRILSVPRGSVALTEREYALLVHLAERSGHPVSRGAIFDSLWAAEGSGNENVVDVYIGYLRKKLSEADFGFEIITIRNQGFCLQGVPPQTPQT